jgi:DNA polymerase III sliding clamp (beta) subunit (PCNA family)
MKLTIERGMLLKMLTHIQSVVERRNTIPILSNVKFDAPDENLSLNATDMDLDIVETVPADVEVHGTISTISKSISVAFKLKFSSGASNFTLERIGMVLRRSTTL